MTWAKLDDRFHSHPKVLRAGYAAAGLYAMGLSYAACHETDGELPEDFLQKPIARRLANQLVAIGLWERIDGGYLIPDFLDFNPSREALTERRKVERERIRRRRVG